VPQTDFKEAFQLKERFKKLLSELTAIHGISGQEQDVVRYMKRELAKVCDSVTVDHMGNVFAVKKGPKPGPTAMIAAHSDEIGATVRSVEKSGFLRFEKIGGTLDPLLVGRKVWVAGHLGVIGVKAGHLQSEAERREVKKSSDLYIDVGAGSVEEVAGMGIEIGSPVTYNSPLEFFTNTDRFSGKAVDDRLGCAILLEIMRQTTPPAGTLVGVVTVQEEVGLRGAAISAFRVNPTFAIVLDTMASGDTPDADFQRELPVAIGMGPVFQYLSGSAGRGFLITPSMKKFLTETARRNGVRYQVTLMPGGGTDANAIHVAREGVPTGVISLSRRYSHSPVETGDINDTVGAFELLKGIIARMAEDLDWSFVE
jgi:putative aminopeptidase FrvX